MEKSIAYKTVLNGKILWYAGEKLAISGHWGPSHAYSTESFRCGQY